MNVMASCQKFGFASIVFTECQRQKFLKEIDVTQMLCICDFETGKYRMPLKTSQPNKTIYKFIIVAALFSDSLTKGQKC